jgi:ABC-2 type transport system permease protein
MSQRATRLAALIRKEAIQTLRDRRTLAIILALPLIELFLFAYAIRLTVDHLPTAVADMSRDAQSRAFVTALVNSHYFDVAGYVASQAEVIQAIDEGRAKVGVVIPPGFAVQIERGNAQVLILLDGSDSFSVNSGYSAAVAVAQARALGLAAEQARRQGFELKTAPITTSTRVLYNPDLNDLVFIMPGLIGLLLQIMAVLTTALAVVRGRPRGGRRGALRRPEGRGGDRRPRLDRDRRGHASRGRSRGDRRRHRRARG